MIRGLSWLHYGHLSDMKTYGECATGILSPAISTVKNINLFEVQKVASLRGKRHWRITQLLQGRAFDDEMPYMRLVWDQGRVAEKMWKNLRSYGKSWSSLLYNASRTLNRLASPSTASFFFFSWHKFFILVRQKYFHSTEHGIRVPSTVPFCMSFLCLKCDSTPTIPPLPLPFIPLTHLEH